MESGSSLHSHSSSIATNGIPKRAEIVTFRPKPMCWTTEIFDLLGQDRKASAKRLPFAIVEVEVVAAHDYREIIDYHVLSCVEFTDVSMYD